MRLAESRKAVSPMRFVVHGGFCCGISASVNNVDHSYNNIV